MESGITWSRGPVRPASYEVAGTGGGAADRRRRGWSGVVGVRAYPGRVLTQRQVVDFALQRRALLADVHSGRTGVAEVCDASPYLLRAARFHGQPSDVTCPVCRKERLTLVSWIFGEELKHAAGSARKPEELERLETLYAEFSVYVVEVCRTCSWNHLVQSYVLGTGGRSGPPARRRSAGE